VTNGSTKIYWEESGVGDPLLLIMGLGYTLEMWHRTRPLVAARFRTIVFDNRGVGRSDVSAEAWSIADMASDAAAVLDAAGVRRAHVFGISMGGMIAQEFAIAYPDRINRLVLGCTACGGPKSIPAAPVVLETLMARANMTPEEGVRAMVPYIYDSSTPRERIEEDLAIRLRTFPRAAGYLGQISAISKWSCYERLGKIAAPTLVIHGETDELVPPENGRILAEKIPGAKLVMLANASHLFTTDRPEESHAAILGWLNQ
jgi:pimeloyl-ACP methyl ester carboxylesterase